MVFKIYWEQKTTIHGIVQYIEKEKVIENGYTTNNNYTMGVPSGKLT